MPGPGLPFNSGQPNRENLTVLWDFLGGLKKGGKDVLTTDDLPASVVGGSGTANQIPYWVNSTTLGSLTTATYPSLTEFSYVKGVTSAIQTQLNGMVTVDQTVGQTIGATGARLTKLWATDITVTNAINGSVTGNAGTATALQNARTIGGVSFDGTANITVASATGGFTISGGNLALGTNSMTLTGSIASTGSRVTKIWTTDLESTNMPTVGGTSLSSTFQALNSNLTTIAGLTATTNNFLQSKSSAWASRTPTQVTADLIAFVGDSGSGGVQGLVPAPSSGDATKYLKGDGTWHTISGGGDALTSNPLSQFASTTSLQLYGVISNPTGTGALVFGTSPTLTTPTIGVATATSINKVTITAPASGSTLTIADGKTLTVSNSLTLAGVDGKTLTLNKTMTLTAADDTGVYTFPTGTATLVATSVTTLASLTSANGSTIPSSDTLVGRATTDTLTNKRITKRAPAITQSATPTINTDNTDVAHITGLAQAITSMTTNLSGTPVQGDTLRIDITDNGSPWGITWGTSFEASTVALPTTTVASTRLDIGFVWNSVTSKWRCVAVA